MSPIRPLTLAAALAASACASSSLPVEASMNAQDADLPGYRPARQWPLKFKSHSFSVMAYDTWGARVIYAGQERRSDDPDVLQRSSASYGPDWQKAWSGTFGMIRNFPPPAQLSWRSKDGTPHQAEIDIGAIFADEVVRHNVAREDMASLPDGRYDGEPAVILEINDRTVRVYMKAMMFLRNKIDMGGVMRNEHRYEPVLVKTYTF